ncbi:pepsin-like aspartic protease [Pleionea sp. CnH1-48]|uniref:pepsin-like aspartic protease n=1 Tax=Pleionea sp. CnH1-48 TaxID=2954494 RepID=UPI002096A019|nr:pepsin-like aspartic protease [Pleionea sp. CnH1-48]MCO7225243.1 A1 family peptidase [Pleionea sp. CnH1-48]
MTTKQKKMLKLPITNIFAKGDYSVKLYLGSERQPAYVVLDTGSSTLAIHDEVYHPQKDQNLTPTTYAQDVTYGVGGWAGPVVHTTLDLHTGDEDIPLNNAPIAIMTSEQENFLTVDGIWGLAYHHLNKAYNMEEYLKENEVNPANTYPWPFPLDGQALNIRDFKHLLQQQPEHDITPYFTELEEHQLVANKFAFYTKRSSIHITHDNAQEADLMADPLNQGFFIIGSGEEHTELYEGDFAAVKILHDTYYNANLKNVRVEGCADFVAPPLDKAHINTAFTNAIIDSGTTLAVLQHSIYQYIIESFTQINAAFADCLAPFKNFDGKEHGIPQEQVKLEEWPNIYFTFEGEFEDVTLTCTPQDYWQVNAPQHGLISFKFLSQLPNWPEQSILGLPVMNPYFCIFDRSEHQLGVVKFARRK